MDGLILTKDVWNLILEELDSQADRASCSAVCRMFYFLVKKGTRKFVCNPLAQFCFKITRLRFICSVMSQHQHPGYVVIGNRKHTSDIGMFPLVNVQNTDDFMVFESPVIPEPFRFRTLQWKTLSFGKDLHVGLSSGTQCTDADLDCQMFNIGELFVDKEDELVIGSRTWSGISCACSIRLLPPD